jgi:transcriptional regulator with XRE-family HTH domain
MHLYSTTKLRSLLAESGRSQAEIAQAAGISQSTVSRALSSNSKRHARARVKLAAYARALMPVNTYLSSDQEKAVVKAFGRIWDGSRAHGEAIVRVIHALGSFGHKVRIDKGGSRERQRGSPQKTSKKNRT